jgi:lysylphosphatidylglycerol synthetase-like protein (DUF2156 family)
MPRLWTVARRLPLTCGLLVVIIVTSIATRSLWDPLAARPLNAWTTYGLPAVEAGSWWTVFPGALFAIEPLQYLPILVGLAFIGGFAEWRLGTGPAAIALTVCHLIGVLGAALLLWATRDHGYQWATDLALRRDAGPSAAFLGAAAAASVTMRPPWRGRLRAGLVVYVWLFLIHMGALADLEHAIAVSAGLGLGPVLVGRAPRFNRRALSRRDFRLLACAFFVLAALEGLIEPFTTVDGPLASAMTPEDQAALARRDYIGAVIQAVLWFALARSLYKGRRRTWRWAVGLLVFVMGLQVVGTILELGSEREGLAASAYQLLGNAFGLAILLIGRRAFRNPSPRRARRTTGHLLAPAGEDQRHAATELLRHEGTVNRLAWMTTWPENRWFIGENHGYVAYRVHAGVAVGLCDPVAAGEADRSALLESFADAVRNAGMVPCLFTVTGEASRHATSLGWHSLQVAEEAVIDLPTLAFTGKAWQDVRTALNQAVKLGIQMRLGPLVEQPRGIQMQVRAISTEWIEDKGLPEMGFTLGGVDEAMDPDVHVALAVDADATVHGVTSWMPIHDVGGGEPIGWTLDVMRRLPGGFRYSMEFLISSACLAYRDRGCRVASLSGAPLARSPAAPTEDALDRGTLDAFLDRLGGALEPYYGFRSLHAFKAKFQPRVDPLYLVFPEGTDLPRIGIALSRAYLPEAGVGEFLTLARSRPS